MKQYTQKEFIRVVEANGFSYERHNGDHAIYLNDNGRHISIPKNLECVIALRLIKENSLETDIKKLKKRRKMSENAPLGADQDRRAPWNQMEPELIETEVLVSVTYSRQVKVQVPEEHDDAILKRAVKEQVKLPADYITDEEMRDTGGWITDDFEVIPE